MDASQTTMPLPSPGWRIWPRRVFQILALIAVMDGLLFGSAGRLDWWGAWALTVLYFVFLLIVVAWASRYSPGLLEERSRMAPNVKTWDKVITSIYSLLLVALLVTAGLDAGRFGWSSMPVAMQVVGACGLGLTGALIWWAMATNTYLSRYARIQDDRGQQVVTTGPYRYVRHPMYAGVVPFMLSLALLLGSWWALVPGGLIAILYVVRTALEDRMLREELPGYEEYAAQVRFRLVPGLW